MERLTKRIGNSVAYSDFNSNHSDGCYEMMDNCLQKLADYEDKQEQGLLIELPCKVGDTVYFPIYDYHDSAIIESIRIEEKGIFLDWCQYEVGVDCTEVWDEGSLSIKDFGKTVFLTRSEAEEALARMKGE